MKTMHRSSLLLALLSGCLHQHSHIAVDGAVLGRVVVYRNGVAFYERNATIEDGKLAVHVPRERVDDFLKSLTVVDRATGNPLSVTIPRKESDDGNYLTMTLETAEAGAPGHEDVLLRYVTEAPAWKPSYRVLVGDKGKVMLEGWAVVDNVSGEDWKNVLVGVGASSALSFRYDLWSVRRVDRDLLQGEDKFAVAPPTGVSPYAEATGAEELAQLDGDEVRTTVRGSSSLENQYYVDGLNTTGLTFGSEGSRTSVPEAPPPTGTVQGVVTDSRTNEPLAGVTVVATTHKGDRTETGITDDKGSYRIVGLPPDSYLVTFYWADATSEQKDVRVTSGKTTPAFAKINSSTASGEVIRIAGNAPTLDPTSTTQGITTDKSYIKNLPVPGRTFQSSLGAAAGSQNDNGGVSFSGSTSSTPPASAVSQGDAKLHGIVAKVIASHKDVLIETHGRSAGEANQKAEAVRNQLVDEGVPVARIHVVPKVAPSETPRVRVLAIAHGAKPEITAPPAAGARGATPDTPVGESRFMTDRPMNVKAGTSAMVAMLHGETTGGIVYLYDPISDRGDKRFAFKAVRLDNPTGNALEPGPVTVYGDGRFIGEGITEPVPAHASVIVPFANDRQVVVERNDVETDKIAKLVTAQRGIVNVELQHRRQARFTVTSRLGEPTKVYLRHRLESGWALLDAPSTFMKVGDSQLFEVDLDPGQTKYVTIAEATPLERSLELGSQEGLGLMKVYIDEPDASAELKAQITALLATHRAGADLTDKIQTLREQLTEYRSRAGELHAQLVTLKLVKTSGDLMTALRTKLSETSERIQKTTISLVDTQEQLMLTRVRFQNQLADLHLTDATAAVSKR
ncbi:MAG: hypothetical protein JWO36_1841 [Myxococcales bacterium]|nr:hypothetical protein [Myxococcales bacterium]